MQRRAQFLPFSRPTIGSEEEAEVLATLRSGWITSGPRVQRFEALFRERLGVEQAVAVNSATAGLHLAVAALDLGPEDEVIVPSITWASTANVVELCGARVVFADVDPGTLCIDPEDVRRRIGPRTRAIVPVHFAGQPADLSRLRELAREAGAVLIEDAAHALGTRYGEEEIGSQAEVAVFSFHPIKNITTGEGGMVVCRDEELARRMRVLRFHGVSKDAWSRYHHGGAPRYEVVEPGWKYNMLDLQAALGLVQMRRLDDFNARRAELAETYHSLLAGLPQIRPLERVAYPATHAWHLFVVRLDLESSALSRDELLGALEQENIGTGLHFPALHLQAYYREKYRYREGSLPASEAASESIFSLPLYPLLEESDQQDVVDALGRVLETRQRERA
jgi:UDP-4-amino-4-deoxy-L-arabinose-oxoglutarate aminotransferase